MADLQRYQHDGLEFARALTFFDAIFAFSVTLLITTVDDFSPSSWTSPHALWEANGSGLVAFTISFIVVIVFWRTHHEMFADFAAIDRTIILVCCAAMFWIVLIPFSTEALGGSDLGGLPLPTAVYALNITLAYLVHRSIPLVADARGLTSAPMTPRQRQALLISMVPMPVLFLGSIAIAYLVDPGWAPISWLVLWPVMAALQPALDRWVAAEPRDPRVASPTDPPAAPPSAQNSAG